MMQLFDVPLADIDLSAPEFWRGPRDFRESAFAKLRNEDPFRFFEEMELAIAPKGRATSHSPATTTSGMSAAIHNFSAAAKARTSSTSHKNLTSFSDR